MEEAHYDTPWEYIHRNPPLLRFDRPHSESPESFSKKRLENVGDVIHEESEFFVKKRNSQKIRGILPITSTIYKNNKVDQKIWTTKNEKNERRASSSEHERKKIKLSLGRFNGQNSSKRERICEEDLVHKNMDRVEAERCLLNHEIGAFLIRRRDNDNLALSIRAVNGNLHIKLEFRNNRWVLGEGPSFNNILTIVNYYRTHELPVRGAERMILRTPILVSTVDSNMYA